MWRAEDTLLRRSVAIKELRPTAEPGQLADLREDILREARAAARLDHPGAVTVFDVLQDDERAFIVMQLVDGPNLAEVLLGDGPLDVSSTANLGLQLLDVLEAAHRQGLIHRDIKPANVMFPSDGRALLADFGIARLIDDPRSTTTGLVRGTPQYMAPEQAAGGEIGPATDLWSLGATLYYAVEGQPPFDRGQALATLASITVDPPRPPKRAGPLEEVLEALLVKDPARRPGDMDVGRRLRAVADSGAPTREFVAPWARSTSPSSEPAPPEPVTPDPAPALEQDATQAVLSEPARAEPPARNEPPARREPAGGPLSARARWMLAGLGLVLVALAATAVVLISGGGSSHHGVASSGRPKANPSTSAPPAAPAGGSVTTGSGSSTAAPTGTVPSNWISYTDPQTGSHLRYPPGWEVKQKGAETTFTDPSTGDYLLIDHQSPPAAPPQGPWYQLEPGFAANHADYQRLGITTTTFHGYPAALWEYRYTAGSRRLHAIDLGMIVGSNGYGFNFQAADDRWSSVQPEVAALEAGFAPAG